MYEVLKNLFYKDKNLYEKTYQERYNSEMSVHIDFNINGNPAFFIETKDIVDMLTRILISDKEVCKLCDKLPGVALKQYQRKCLIDEITLTNNIEGVYSTRREIDTLLDNEGEWGKRNRFRGLVQKYLMLLSRDNIELKTSQDIRKIYDDLVLEEIKEADPSQVPDGVFFRKDSVSVESETGKELHRGLYPETKIIEGLEKSLQFLNGADVSLLLKIAAFHYLFGYIHPFYDGNGRTSRFISGYLMTQCLEPIISFRLSYTIKQRLSEYYKAFKICNDPRNKGDITPFVAMFLDIILDSITQLISALKDKIEKRCIYDELCKLLPGYSRPKTADLYNYLTQATLFSEKGISTADLKCCLEISDATLRKRLNEISKNQILISQRFGHEKYYMLDAEKLLDMGKSIIERYKERTDI